MSERCPMCGQLIAPIKRKIRLEDIPDFTNAGLWEGLYKYWDDQHNAIAIELHKRFNSLLVENIELLEKAIDDLRT